MHRNFEAMNIGKEPPDDNGKAPRPMKTYAAGALAAAAVLALFSLVAGSESIASLGGDAQEKWNDVPCPAVRPVSCIVVDRLPTPKLCSAKPGSR